MLTTALIAFREFFETFLLLGLFIGLNRRLHLNKQKEIFLAAIVGVSFSLLLPILVFVFANDVSGFLTEKNADTVEGYLLTFSGVFLAYVVFSLHAYIKQFKTKTMQTVKKKMEQRIFDNALFFTLVFFIAREGFEIALLVSTTSLFSVFSTNLAGLVIGFGMASVIGLAMAFSYIKLPVKKIFFYTESLIVIIGAAMVKNGVSILFEAYSSIHLDKIMPINFRFLPNESTITGHVIKNLFGITQQVSILQLCVMSAYILAVYFLFFKKKEPVKAETL